MWEDILEALAVGGSGAISGYMQTQEANAARAERERERQAMEAYREATMAMDRERLEMARAAADEAERKDIERRMGSGELRVAREIPNLAAARSTIDEALKAGEGPEDMFEGAGLGMAAKPAAGQTYAAQMQREKEQERTDVGRTPMSFLDEIPEFEPSETFQEAGSREFEGQALRPTTPAERAATEREVAIAGQAAEIQAGQDALRAQEDFLRERFPDLTDAQIAETVYGVQPQEVETPSMTALQSNFNFLRSLPDFADKSDSEILEMAQGGGRGAQTTRRPTLPAAVGEKVAANNAIIQASEDILQGLQTDAVRGVGIRFAAPVLGGLLERTGTPEERALRALIANVGSQLLAARSGAAISEQEFRKLSPFVPAIGDDPESIEAKVRTLSRELDRINSQYYQVFSPDVAVPGGQEPTDINSILDDVYSEPAQVGPTISGLQDMTRSFNNEFFLNGGMGG